MDPVTNEANGGSPSQARGTRVLYVTKTSIVGDGGGGEKRAREVVSRLADRDYRPTVVCGRTEPGLERWDTYEGSRVRHVTAAPEAVLDWDRLGFYLPRYLFAFASLPVLAVLLARDDFDVVVENMTPYPTLTVVLARAFGVPIIAVQHEFHGRDCLEMYDPLTGRIQLVVQQLLRVFEYDALVVPASHTKTQLREYGVATDRIEVVPNGINAAAYHRPGIETDACQLVTVGRLCKRKGQADLLRAFARLRSERPELRLDVVGDGPRRAELEAQAESLGIDDAVTFHGYVDQAAKVRLLNRAKLFVFASRQEGFGLALLEAMAAGLPVVARKLPVYDDVMATADDGQLVGEPFERAFVEAVDSLLASEDTTAIGDRNRQIAAQYDWDTTADGMTALIDSIVSPVQETAIPVMRRDE